MKTVNAIGDKVLAEMIDKPNDFKQTRSGIYIADKDGDVTGIRPRWFKLTSIGPDCNMDIAVGQYVLVDHGRWSQGIKIDDELKVYLLDNKDLLMVSDEDPIEEGYV